MQVQPYLFLEGRAEEAIEFYRSALGAEVVMLMRFKESPDQSNIQPGSADKVMHASLNIGGGTLMLSDGHCSGKQNFGGFALSLAPKDEASATKLFNALSDGGQVTMPLTKTFWSPGFGMLTDRFGIMWMINREA